MGTRHRLAGPSQRSQCLLAVLRTLVVPLSGSMRSSCLKSTSLPFGARPDADGGRDRGLGGHLQLQLLAGHLQRADEAGGIARREQLLRIGAVAAGAAQFLRRRELGFEGAVFRPGLAVAAAGGGGAGGIEDVDGHGGLLGYGFRDIEYRGIYFLGPP